MSSNLSYLRGNDDYNNDQIGGGSTQSSA